MELDIRRQAILLAAAFLLGFALGLCYDILRPIRRKCASLGAALIDFLFSFLSAAGMFLFSMSAGSGRLGLWELTAALLGFLCYIYTVSDTVFPLFDRAFLLLLKSFSKFKLFLKNVLDSAKKSLKK